jgi:MFS family permease
MLPVNTTIKPQAIDADAAGPASTTTSRLGALLLLAATIASVAALRIVFSPLQELAKRDLGLTDLQLSLAQGLAASIPIALLALPIGRLIDRSNRIRLLLALTLASVAGTFLTASARSFEALFFARMLAGLGFFCAIPVAISIAADLSPLERRGRALLLLSVGQAVGVALGFALGGGLLQALPHGAFHLVPWRAAHVLFGLAGLVLLLPLFRLAGPERHELGNVVHPAFRVVLHQLWLRRAYLAPLFVGQVSVVMADVAAGVWAAPVLTRDLGLRPEQFAGWMGMAVLLPGIVGSIVGGLAADRGRRSRMRGGILLGAIVAATLSIPAAWFPMAPTLPTFALSLAAFLLCGSITGLVTATVIATVIPNELRGMCLGAFVVVSSVIGMGVAPTAVTLVSGALGGESHLAQALAWSGAVVSIVSSIAFIFAARALPRPETIA